MTMRRSVFPTTADRLKPSIFYLRDLEKGIVADEGAWEYPGPYCAGKRTCKSCPRFFCTRCRKYVPWCVGHAEPHPFWCDDCVYRGHDKKKCRECREIDKASAVVGFLGKQNH